MGGFCRGFLRKGQLDPTEAGGTRGERKGAPPRLRNPILASWERHPV